MVSRSVREECDGQLDMICRSCEGSRLVKSEDTITEVCRDCDGSGIDLDAAHEIVVVRSYYLQNRAFTPPPSE